MTMVQLKLEETCGSLLLLVTYFVCCGAASPTTQVPRDESLVCYYTELDAGLYDLHKALMPQLPLTERRRTDPISFIVVHASCVLHATPRNIA